MVSTRKTVRQVTALCALAVFALTGCEQTHDEKQDARPENQAEQKNGLREDRWTNRSSSTDDHEKKAEEKIDDWGQPTSEQVDETEDNWGKRPNGNGSRSSSEGWSQTHRPQRDADKATPNDKSRGWGQGRPSSNGSRSSSEGWSSSHRPQRDADKATPNESSSKWGQRTPSRNGTRSSSEGWTESYQPTKKGERAPSERRAAIRDRARQVRENLGQMIDTARDLSTFVAALRESGLFDTLEGRGPFTVFAPTNEAFEGLASGKLDDLLKPENRNELREMLSYHIVSGKLSTDQVGKLRSLRSLQGQTLTITMKNGKVYVDDAEIADTGMDGTNGVIHIINKVLIPE